MMSSQNIGKKIGGVHTLDKDDIPSAGELVIAAWTMIPLTFDRYVEISEMKIQAMIGMIRIALASVNNAHIVKRIQNNRLDRVICFSHLRLLSEGHPAVA